MPYVVQLDLGAGASRIAELCDALDPAVETVTRLGDVPHLSLAIYDELNTEAYAVRLRAFADTLEPFSLRLAGLGVFAAATHVLYAAPVVTSEVLALHRRFHDSFTLPGAVCHEHYRPGAWVPHVTLALNLSAPQLHVALAIATSKWAPFAGEIDAIRLIRYWPVETLWHRRLGRAVNP